MTTMMFTVRGYIVPEPTGVALVNRVGAYGGAVAVTGLHADTVARKLPMQKPLPVVRLKVAEKLGEQDNVVGKAAAGVISNMNRLPAALKHSMYIG